MAVATLDEYREQLAEMAYNELFLDGAGDSNAADNTSLKFPPQQRRKPVVMVRRRAPLPSCENDFLGGAGH